MRRALVLRQRVRRWAAPRASLTSVLLALVVFFSFAPGAVAALASGAAPITTVQASTVQIIPTWQFTPPAPDPAGIVYLASEDRFLISDSEVDEMPIYQGKNLYTATRTGSGVGTGTTFAFSKEPTGLGFNPTDGTLFVADDDRDKIYLDRTGPDGSYGSADDVVTSFSTIAFGSGDAEDVAYDPATGHLFITDGATTTLYQVNPVNGTFGDADDIVTSSSVGQYGSRDGEGVAVDPRTDHVLVVDPSTKSIYELTKSGDIVRIVDCRGIPTTNKALAGITLAPTSDSNDDPAKLSYWVVDRHVDNGADPNENDGLLYELTVPTDDAAPTVSITAPTQTFVSQAVTIHANATGATQVAFSVDGASIGTDTNGADGWTAAWDTTTGSDGSHVVTATATGTGGSASDSKSYVADNTAPSVAVTAPAAGATVTGTVTVSASASDSQNLASVEFFVDGASIGKDTDGSDGWSASWDSTTQADGTHTLTAIAADSAGNTTTSAASDVTVSNASVQTANVPIAVGADDADEILSTGAVRRSNGDLELGSDSGAPTAVGLRFNGVAVPQGATVVGAYVQFQVDETNSAAATVTVRAESADNSSAFTTATFGISSRPRTNGSATWTVPTWTTAGAAGAGQRTPDLTSVVQEVVNRSGWAAGNSLTIIITGTGRRTAESFEGGAPPVLHLEYRAAQDKTPPTVSLTSPASGATLAGAVGVSAAASDNQGLASVQFRVDGASIGTDTNDADGWSTSWDTTSVPDGAHTITAVALDTAGNSSTSPGVGVTVSNANLVTANVAIAVGVDDADELSTTGAVRRTNSDLELGSDHATPTTVGLRFTGVPVPRGATVVRAYLQFQVDETNKAAATVTVRAESADNSSAFTTATFGISSRPRTNGSATWMVPTWTTAGAAGAGQRTPDLTSVVEEVVNRSGWAAGNSLTIIITGTGRRTAESFEGGAPPVLHLEYVL
jgi:hypothetical protein